MASIEPPPPEPAPASTSSSTAAGCLGFGGAVVGLVAAVALSLAGLAVTATVADASCGGSIAAGIVEVGVAALAAYAAWRLIRHPGGGPALTFLRPAAIIVSAFLLVPWPCSYTWIGAFTVWGACARH